MCLTFGRMMHMSETAPSRIPVLTLGWRLKMALGDMKAGDMAELLGVDRSTVSRWMADRGAPPRRVYVRQWAMATGVDVEWLERGTTKPQPDGGPAGASSPLCAIKDSNLEPTDSGHAAAAREGDVLPLHRPTTQPAAARGTWAVAA